MKRIIHDRIDSRQEKNFVFVEFWKWYSEILITTLSNQAKEYFNN